MGDEPDFRGSTKEKGNYKRCPGGREGGWQGRVSANEEGAGRNILLSQRWGNNGLSRLLNRADPLKLRWKKRKEGMAFARIRNMFPAICVAFPRDIEINLGSVFFFARRPFGLTQPPIINWRIFVSGPSFYLSPAAPLRQAKEGGKAALAPIWRD